LKLLRCGGKEYRVDGRRRGDKDRIENKGLKWE
jgi:hypothetical protein